MPLNSLCKHETIAEFTFIEDRRSSCLSDELVDEPLEVALEYTFALDSVLRKNSIQTGFGGHRLPSTVEDFYEVITNGSDVVAVQKHFRLISFRVESNLSVARLPVDGVTNGSIHLSFDLTHWGCPSTTNVVWHGVGGSTRGLVPPCGLSLLQQVRIIVTNL